MAKEKLTGKTAEQIEALREEYSREKPFEDQYCLAKIPHQPEDYDGPDRYCTLQRVQKLGSNYLCEFHGGAGSMNEENVDKLSAMKHGMHATRDHLIEDFDEKDQHLYDWITGTWPDAYDISVEEDPSAAYDLHRLAAEIVRAERGRGFLIEEGEVHEVDRISDEGQIVVDDETGEVVTEKSEHYLAQMMDRQDRKITKLEKELGITRKERMKQNSTDNAVEAIKDFAELGGAFLNRDEKDYDPDNEPWDESDDT